MKHLGVALGGGGLRGLAHIGVLQVLQDNGIDIFTLSGTSIGGIVACLYASGMDAYEMQEVVTQLKPKDYLDYNFKGLIQYILGLLVPGKDACLDGLIKGKKLERLIYKLTRGKGLTDIDQLLSVVACNIDSGKEVVFSNCKTLRDYEATHIKRASLSVAARCSSSIPATFAPYYIGEMQIVDGGIKAMVPVGVQKAMGAEYILAVNLGHREYHETVSCIPQIVSRTINILTYETSDTDEKLYADMILYPAVGDVNLDDMEKAVDLIQAGRIAMETHMNKLNRDLFS